MKIEPTHMSFFTRMQKEKENEGVRLLQQTTTKRQDDIYSIQKEANEVTNLMQNLHYEEVVREEKLQQIQAQIEAGTYNITGKDVIKKWMGGR